MHSLVSAIQKFIKKLEVGNLNELTLSSSTRALPWLTERVASGVNGGGLGSTDPQI